MMQKQRIFSEWIESLVRNPRILLPLTEQERTVIELGAGGWHWAQADAKLPETERWQIIEDVRLSYVAARYQEQLAPTFNEMAQRLARIEADLGKVMNELDGDCGGLCWKLLGEHAPNLKADREKDYPVISRLRASAAQAAEAMRGEPARRDMPADSFDVFVSGLVRLFDRAGWKWTAPKPVDHGETQKPNLFQNFARGVWSTLPTYIDDPRLSGKIEIRGDRYPAYSIITGGAAFYAHLARSIQKSRALSRSIGRGA